LISFDVDRLWPAIPAYRVNLARKQINSFYKELDQFEAATIENFDPNNRAQYIETLNEMGRRVLSTKATKLATADCYFLKK
jgi:hypothetical protein